MKKIRKGDEVVVIAGKDKGILKLLSKLRSIHNCMDLLIILEEGLPQNLGTETADGVVFFFTL